MWLALWLACATPAPPAVDPPAQSEVDPPGLEALRAGDFSAAQAALAPDAEGASPRHRMLLGVAMVAQGNTFRGLQHVSAAGETTEDGPGADLARNVAAEAAGKPPPVPWDELLAAAPTDYVAHWLRAAMSRTATVDERLAWYDAAIAVDAAALLAWVGKATLLDREGRHADALAVFDAAVPSCGSNPELWRLRADHLLAGGELAEAAAALERAVGLAPDDGTTRGRSVLVAELAGAPVDDRPSMDDLAPDARAAWLESLPAHRLALGQDMERALLAASECADAAVGRGDGPGAVRCAFEALRVAEHTDRSAAAPARAIAERVATADALPEQDRADAEVLATWLELWASAGGTPDARAAFADRDLRQTGMWSRRRRMLQLTWAAAADPVATEADARAAEPPPSRCDDAWALARSLHRAGRDASTARTHALALRGPCRHEGWDAVRRRDLARLSTDGPE